jgi:dephospho-CoA kinase
VKPVIGLVGAIGAGKSVAAAAFAGLGGVVIDADRLGHAVLELAEVKSALVERWGERVLRPNGSVDRRAVAEIVFADPAERKALEVVVFPPITALAREQVAAAQADPSIRFVVLDAPTLLEAGWESLVDRLVYVDAPRPVRLARVRSRGWTAADLAAREAAQLPAAEKLARCDAVVVNDGSVDELQARIDHLLGGWGLLPADAGGRT